MSAAQDHEWADSLLELFADPADAGRRACAIRERATGTRIRIRAAPPLAPGVRAAVLRGGQAHEPALEPGPSDSPAFPDLKQLAPGDRVIVRVDHGEMPDYCAWLVRAFHGMPATCSLAPYAPTPGGLFRLHLLAAARIVLPHAIDIEARHDLIGVRLAQVALQFGVNTLAGPIDPARHLPLAGIPRPSETSLVALSELVRQAGLDPFADPT